MRSYGISNNWLLFLARLDGDPSSCLRFSVYNAISEKRLSYSEPRNYIGMYALVAPDTMRRYVSVDIQQKFSVSRYRIPVDILSLEHNQLCLSRD